MPLKDHWYIAARSQDLTTSPIPRMLMGQRLVLFRDSAGTASALVDRCSHRNAPLSKGAVVNGCLQCPYHGWSYDGSGRVTEVPSEPVGSCPPQPRSMRAYP